MHHIAVPDCADTFCDKAAFFFKRASRTRHAGQAKLLQQTMKWSSSSLVDEL
ncbi:MAG: hypothetical protein G3I11_02840 [Ferrovum sp.]|nr:hypothetical protein [Ferrovum sp.]